MGTHQPSSRNRLEEVGLGLGFLGVLGDDHGSRKRQERRRFQRGTTCAALAGSSPI